MPRAIWKGSLSFGLVHIPVQLYPAVRSADIDFDWLDKRSMAPIGYRRINKRTGREVDRQFIVRGFEYEPGRYVVLSDEEIKAANPKATQSVDILSFCDLQEISFLHLETPYYLAPDKKGGKVYALLREALRKSGKVGLAQVVMHSKQHLAALIPWENALVLNTLRWAGELRDSKDLDLPATKAGALRDKELAMARQLIEAMSEPLNLRKYRESFRSDILALVKRKIKSGKEAVVPVSKSQADTTQRGNVIDLTELLKRSLNGQGQRAPASKSSKSRAAPKKHTATAEKRRHAP